MTVEKGAQTFQPSSAGLSRRSRLENLTIINVIPDARNARSGIQEPQAPPVLDSRLRGNDDQQVKDP
jgi:hypothetical protein